MNRPGAIVIGGDYRGLGVARSLGRRGIPVWVLYDEHRLASLSRFAQRSFAWPAETTETKQVAYLLQLGETHQLDGWALFPTGDEAAALIARHHEQLGHRFRLTTPRWPVLRSAYDKRLTYHLAERLGIDYPWTRCPRGRAEVAALDCPFPVIVKPAIKPEANALTVAKAWRADDRRELLAQYDAACQLLRPELIIMALDDPLPALAEVPLSGLLAVTRALAERTGPARSMRQQRAHSAASEP